MKRETVLTFAADEDRDAALAARAVDLRAALTDFQLELETLADGAYAPTAAPVERMVYLAARFREAIVRRFLEPETP